MGFDYSRSRNYKELEAIYNLWHNFSDDSMELIRKYGIDLERVQELKPTGGVKVHEFFKLLSSVVDLNLKELQESYKHFLLLFKGEEMPLKGFSFYGLNF